MNEILERQAMMDAAYDRERTKAFQEGLNALRRTHPDRWVAYRTRWDDQRREYEFILLAEFASHGEAVAWGMKLPDAERSMVSLMSTRTPEPGVFRI